MICLFIFSLNNRILNLRILLEYKTYNQITRQTSGIVGITISNMRFVLKKMKINP